MATVTFGNTTFGALALGNAYREGGTELRRKVSATAAVSENDGQVHDGQVPEAVVEYVPESRITINVD